jgi:dimethyl sulfoxide reductase iron-sulfur subunit
MRYGMVIDLRKCVGCNACSLACRQEYGTPQGILYSRVLNREVGTYPSTRFEILPLLCMHCDNPACVAVCPVGATYKRADGIVFQDKDKCIGCKRCIEACPYGARFFNDSASKEYFPGQGKTAYETAKAGGHAKETVEKCSFCAERVEAGLQPACVQSCTATARYFGDLDDPDSEVVKLIAKFGGKPLQAELGTKPKVYYLPA